MNIDDFLAGAKLPETTIKIMRDASIIADREELVAQVQAMGRTATARRGDPRTKLYSQIEELDKRIEDEGMAFRLRAARPDWLDEHRKEAVSEEESAAAEYAYAMLAECSVEPKVAIDQARALRSAIGQSQWATITQAMLALTYGEAPRTPFFRPTSEEMA